MACSKRALACGARGNASEAQCDVTRSYINTRYYAVALRPCRQAQHVQRPFVPAMSSFPDYYQILGVSPTASQDEIRQAYKIQSLKCVSSLKGPGADLFILVAL